jgi:hypothetical protein
MRGNSCPVVPCPLQRYSGSRSNSSESLNLDAGSRRSSNATDMHAVVCIACSCSPCSRIGVETAPWGLGVV